MSNDKLEERGRALEDKFFQDQDRAALQALKEKTAQTQAIQEIGTVTGIDDAALLQRVVQMGVRPQTMAAFALVPLIHVAWGDLQLDESEKTAILDEAQSMGLTVGSPAFNLLQGWLSRRPQIDLFHAWEDYFRELKRHMTPDDLASTKAKTLDRCRRVAKASGGLLGIGAVSAEEREALAQVEKVFAG